MRADPAGPGPCAALACRRGTSPSPARERTSDARAAGPSRTLPQVLRVVRSCVGRAERSPSTGQRAAPRGAGRGRPAPALVLPRAARRNTEARTDRAEARRRRPTDARRIPPRQLDRPHGAERDHDRARMERGEIADGDRLARQSATGAAEDHAHLALLRGETDVADRILSRAPTGFPEDEQFRNNVRAIVRAEKGDPRGGVRMLDEAAKEFEARGMAHWALGAAVHAAYWRESLVRGGGASRAAGLVRDIGAGGGG